MKSGTFGLSRRALLSAMAAAAAVVSFGFGAPAQAADGQLEWFVDRAGATGLLFHHVSGMSGQFYQPEISGPGAARAGGGWRAWRD